MATGAADRMFSVVRRSEHEFDTAAISLLYKVLDPIESLRLLLCIPVATTTAWRLETRRVLSRYCEEPQMWACSPLK